MSAVDIQKLREETGAGVMDCKKAFQAAGGDYKKALEHIRAQGLAKAVKKSERATGAHHLESYIHNGRVGVLLDISAETDFVTRSDAFRELAKNLALHISAMNPESVDALLKQAYVRDETMTVADYIKSIIAKVGENISVIRFTRYET